MQCAWRLNCTDGAHGASMTKHGRAPQRASVEFVACLPCHWVGSLDFSLLGNILQGVSLEPTRSLFFLPHPTRSETSSPRVGSLHKSPGHVPPKNICRGLGRCKFWGHQASSSTTPICRPSWRISPSATSTAPGTWRSWQLGSWFHEAARHFLDWTGGKSGTGLKIALGEGFPKIFRI